MNIKLICIFTLIFAAASIAAAQSPDLAFKTISRVAGKNELMVTVENKGSSPAGNVSLKIYALPARFCVSAYQYESAKSVIESMPCGSKPSDIPPTKQTLSIELSKNPRAMAWATVSAEPFDIEPGATVERTVKFPQSMRGSIDKDAPTVFPVPFAPDHGMFNYARKSFAIFETSVFYAVVESSDESKVKTDNNTFLFKHPVVVKIPK